MRTDESAADRIYVELAAVLERGLPSLSPLSADRPGLDRMLNLLKRRTAHLPARHAEGGRLLRIVPSDGPA